VQHLIDTAAGNPGQRAGIRRTLDELFLLSHRALVGLHRGLDHAPAVVQQIIDEGGGRLPPLFVPLGQTHAHAVAVATALAVAAHTPGDTGDAVLAWIVQHGHTVNQITTFMLIDRWRGCHPELLSRVLTTLDTQLRIHSRLSYGTTTAAPARPTRTAEHAAHRAAALPSLMWPAWAMRLIPATTTGTNRLGAMRAALAVMTLIPGTRLSHRNAVALLGDYTTTGSARSLLTLLPPEHLEPTILLLHQLADILDTDPGPIDYTRRRKIFTPAATTVSRRAYATLARTNDWCHIMRGGRPHPLHLRILDHHLCLLLTGAPPRRLDRRVDSAWNPLLLSLPAAVRDFVHDQARHLLRAHDIDEPVTWQPPPPQLPAAPWPGLDPSQIDPDQFAHAFAQHAMSRRPIARLAEATGLHHSHLQLYAQHHPIDMPEPLWRSIADTPPSNSDQQILHQLYHDQRLPIQQIAHRSLRTPHQVRQELTAQGTTLPRTRPRRVNLTREWFEQNYINTGKTVRATAREAGCSVTTLRLYARRFDIPFGVTAPPHDPFADWSDYHKPPPHVAAAFAGPHGTTWIRQILAMAEHPTQRAAAATLGITEQLLGRHRQCIERAAGIRIFNPWLRMTPTPEGREFLHHAAKALRRLDKRATVLKIS
jgi:hypothetical protein